MKVVEIRSEGDFRELRTAWNDLLSLSSGASTFLTWEWTWAWWSAYGVPGELRILAISDDQGVLRGIAPLRCGTAKRYGQKVAALSFLADGSNDSDYLDFIAAPGYERQVVETVYAHSARMLNTGGALLLNEISEASPHVSLLQSVAESRGMAWHTTDVPCATVRLPENWDAYLRMLQSRFRTKVRSVLRNLESRPEVQFRFCRSEEELERLLPILFDLHTRRWSAEGKPGVFGWDRKRDFYFQLSRLLLEREWLRLSWLEWKGQVLACQYGFVYGSTYYQLQEGYDPASEHWNPGVGLRAWSIREFLAEGLREYDFMAGVGRHKTSWGAEVKQSKRILVAGKDYRNLLIRKGPEWEAAGREWLRQRIPERVLAARKAWMQGSGQANGDGHMSWAHRAAAGCYFRSGLPELTRRWRERYQLSIDRGAPLRISWKRREQPSARIFYYHRVNDDRDPFFDAMSTRQFEEQIRYLARHYRVVGLVDLMRRLEDGNPAEPVVAITFDDGYQDNYRNAFPILQRYGVPATIFLSTGSIDSGEPLWFERLAEAVQVASQESLDLEIDIPRRLWLRTEAERLQAHNEIFRLLRRFDDSRRRYWVDEILKQLRAPEVSRRRNSMLTWDQVRLMKAAGIDFGGHTVTHPFLSKLTPAEASWEVSECKRRIEAELQSPADFFAYPNGREEDFAASNKDLLRAAGYRAAVTTIWGINDRSTDRMELRRGGPWESDPAVFASKLDWYQWVNQ